jgi:uncharacterized protein YkwD
MVVADLSDMVNSPSNRFVLVLAAITLLACAGCAARHLWAQDAARQSPAPTKAQASEGETIGTLVALHNQERKKEGLPPLKANRQLEAAAIQHARDMAAHNKLSHEGSDGSKPRDRIKKTGYPYQTIGENVADGQETPAEAIESWMNSPPHKKNILGPFTEIGAAVATAEDGTRYWCVDFGKPFPHLEASKAAETLIEAINNTRGRKDLPELHIDPKLSTAAQEEAEALAEQQTLKPKGKPFEWVERSGYQFRAVAQCLASGQPDPKSTLDGWMHQNAQRDTVLGKYSDIGIGYATDKNGTPYWCALFAQPAWGN